MAVITEFGQLDLTGVAGGTQTTTISNFASATGRAIIFWNAFGDTVGQLNGPGYQSGFGVATAIGVNSSTISFGATNGLDISDGAARLANFAGLNRESASPQTLEESIQFLGFAVSGSGTFDWSLGTIASAPSTAVNFLVIGDDDGSVEASIVLHVAPSSPTTSSVTGFGFQPDVVLGFYVGTSGTGTVGLCTPAVSMITAAATRSASVSAHQNQGNTNTNNETSSDIHAFWSNGTSRQRGTVTGFTADGFDVDWTVSNGRAFRFLGLRGVNPILGTFSTPLTPSTVNIPLSAVSPKAVFFANTGQQLDEGITPNFKLDFGGTDGTGQASMSIYDQDNIGVVSNGRDTSSAHVIQARDNTMAIADSASCSFNGQSLDIIFDVADATLRDVHYLAIGDLGGPPAEPLSAALVGSVTTAGEGTVTPPPEPLSSALVGSVTTAGEADITSPVQPLTSALVGSVTTAGEATVTPLLSAALVGSVTTAGEADVTPPAEPLSAALVGSVTTAGAADVTGPGIEPLSAALVGSVTTAGEAAVTPLLSASPQGSITTAGNGTVAGVELLTADLVGSVTTAGAADVTGPLPLSASPQGSITTAGNGTVAGVELLSAALTGSVLTDGAGSVTPFLTAALTGTILTAGNAQVGEYAPTPCRTATVGESRSATVGESRIAYPSDCH